MMPNILSWITAAIAIVGFLAAAAVYLRGAKDKGTIETLQRNNQALAERVDILEDRNNDLVQEGKARDLKVEAQAQTISVLEKTVNSRDLIISARDDIKAMAQANHELIRAVQKDTKAENELIREILKAHHKETSEVLKRLSLGLENLPGSLALIFRQGGQG